MSLLLIVFQASRIPASLQLPFWLHMCLLWYGDDPFETSFHPHSIARPHRWCRTCYIWLVDWNIFFHILGMSSSQVTFIFFRGVETTNQIQFDDDVSHYFSLVTIKQQYTDNPSIIAPKFARLKPNFYPIALTHGNFWSYPTFRYKSCKQTCYPIISP